MPPPEDRGVIYALGISHLDTQWRWTVEETVREFLPRTVLESEQRFRRFPSFVLNFDGSFRYDLLERHHPDLFATVRRRVREGRWHVAGAMIDAADVNIPSPEALVRHVLYASLWYREAFGIEPRDLFLPDCFGFSWILPTVAAHCGLRGFLTQKLRKGGVSRAARGIPFPIGWWQGPDGARILAVLDPGEYGDTLNGLLQYRQDVRDRLRQQERVSGHPIAVFLYGVGDTGGAPGERTLGHLEASVASNESPEVRCVGSNEMIQELRSLGSDLPVHDGEFLLGLHGTGCYTSQGAMKRWNRANQRLGFAAEAFSVLATLRTGRPYPRDTLRRAWIRMLWHQAHDDITGTSIPAAYRISWHDELATANQFSTIFTDAVAEVGGQLDTSGSGRPVLVVNRLPWTREGLAEIRVDELPSGNQVAAKDPEGRLVPVQIIEGFGGPRALFPARIGGVGIGVYRLVSGTRAPSPELSARAGERTLSNGRLRAEIDDHGDLVSLFDHELQRELLGGPCGFELFRHPSRKFPAWEIHRSTLTARPCSRLRRRTRIRRVETGPLRAALEIRRSIFGADIVQLYRLAAGAERLEIVCWIDWRKKARLLKADFPLAVAPDETSFDLGWAVIRRPVSDDELWEVPAQGWVQLSSEDEDWGVTIATDGKHGWDRPEANRPRLTLVHSPAVGLERRRYQYQARLDHGRHRVAWAIWGHRGTWDQAAVPRTARELEDPLTGFATDAHPGSRGKRCELVESGTGFEIQAVKMEEEGDRVVIRGVERTGDSGSRSFRLAGRPEGVERLDGRERPRKGEAPRIRDRRVDVRLGGCEPVTMALRLDHGSEGAETRGSPIALTADSRVAVSAGEAVAEGVLGSGRWLPREGLPNPFESRSVLFELAADRRRGPLGAAEGRIWTGERAAGGRLHLLGFGTGSDPGTVEVGAGAWSREKILPSAFERLGSWEVRGTWWKRSLPAWWERTPLARLLLPCYDPDGRALAYSQAALFHVAVDLPRHGNPLWIDIGPATLVLALTLEREPVPTVRPMSTIFDAQLEESGPF